MRLLFKGVSYFPSTLHKSVPYSRASLIQGRLLFKEIR